jgi:hypothetical protein
MRDTMGNGNVVDGIATRPSPSAPYAEGGLINVRGMSFDELSATIGAEDLGRALDYILASGQNGSGYHGFSNHIGSAHLQEHRMGQ